MNYSNRLTRRLKVNGPPGTGKTTLLMAVINQAVTSGLYRPDRIALLTYSTAAAQEARHRIGAVLPATNYEDWKWFGTIHSVCKRLLGIKKEDIFAGKATAAFAEAVNVEVSSVNGQQEGLFSPKSALKFGDICRSIKSYSLNTGKSLQDCVYNINRRGSYNQEIPFSKVVKFLRDQEEFKKHSREGMRRYYDFDDMLQMAFKAKLYPDVDLLIVDEAQDLSSFLWRIINSWVESTGKIIIAGDPYQAIYEFMGASPDLMLNWQSDREVTLDESFRCPSQVYEASRRIVRQMSNRYPNDGFTPRFTGGFVKSLIFKRSLKSILQDQQFGSIFLLCRANYQVNIYMEILKAAGIPFGHISSKRKDLLKTKDANIIFNLERLRRGEKIDVFQLSDIVQVIPTKNYLQRGVKKRLSERISRFTDQETDNPEKNIGLTDLISLDFHQLAIDEIQSGEIFSHLLRLEKEFIDYLRRVIRVYGLSLQGQKTKLKVGTMHSCKGKEADLVMIDPELPYKALKAYKSGDSDNEHRLAYVAITRAKKAVYIDDVSAPSMRCYNFPVGPFIEEDYSANTLDRQALIVDFLGAAPPSPGDDFLDDEEIDYSLDEIFTVI